MKGSIAHLEPRVDCAGSFDFVPTLTPTPTPTAIATTSRMAAATQKKSHRLSPQIVSRLDDLVGEFGGGILRAVSRAMVELLPGLRGSGLPMYSPSFSRSLYSGGVGVGSR